MFRLVGQEHITSIWRRFCEQNALPHAVFYGPAGCGKTTFARQIAQAVKAPFFELDAANFSLARLRECTGSGGLFAPVIFIDEIHRLNAAQQDSLLKPLESEEFVLLCASTEPPAYSLSRALNSRLLSFEFKPLSQEQMAQIIAQNLLPGEQLEPAAREFLLRFADARAVINLLRHARTLGSFSAETFAALKDNFSPGYEHEAVLISALIKSMRGSDANAAIYYLARLLCAGVEPKYLARRLVIFAAEDIGNAQPNALLLASAALSSVQEIGMPEARIILSQVVSFCAQAKKSNASYKAINAAMAYCKSAQNLPKIPEFLNNRAPAAAEYIYPHEAAKFRPQMQPYAPGVPRFYEPRGVGYEANFALWAQQGWYE